MCQKLSKAAYYFRLTCDAFAIPPPGTMGWSAHGAALITSVPGGRFDKEEEGRPDGIRSTLVIRSADRGDFGVGYNCSVATTHGEDSFVVTLEEQSEEEKKRREESSLRNSCSPPSSTSSFSARLGPGGCGGRDRFDGDGHPPHGRMQEEEEAL